MESLTWRQEAILAGILRDQRAIAAAGWHAGDNLPAQQRGRCRMAFRRAAEGLVPMNMATWLGCVPSPSERVGLARDCERLEKMGLLERHNLCGGTRTTHLRLTAAGRKMAEGILGTEEPIATNGPLDIGDLELMPIEWPPESAAEAPVETDAPAAP